LLAIPSVASFGGLSDRSPETTVSIKRRSAASASTDAIGGPLDSAAHTSESVIQSGRAARAPAAPSKTPCPLIVARRPETTRP
jgi:hypothetical protein